MGKKINQSSSSSLLNPKSEPESKPISLWPWPTCGSPKTLSFRVSPNHTSIFNSIINPAYIHHDHTSNPTAESKKKDDDSAGAGDSSIETVIRGLRSETERLFFQPGETSSIMEEATIANKTTSSTEDDKNNDDGVGVEFVPFKGSSVAMAMDSINPFMDFRRSMEEMVEALGINIRDWECLEELLSWYLKANAKSNHGYIIGAFVDLLLSLPSSSSSSSSSPRDDRPSSSSTTATANSFTSPLSFSSSSTSNSYTSPCLSSLETEDEIEKATNGDEASSLTDA